MLAGFGFDVKAIDVALIFQHLDDGQLDFGGRNRHGRLGHHLRITNSRQQVGNGVTHAHIEYLLLSYQLALVMPGILPAKAISRILARPKPN